MSIAARTETAEQRAAIYAALIRRNRLVGLLRIGLPVIGGIVLAGLLVQLFIGSLIPDFGFANITIDRDNLVVETPAYSGVGADGTVYTSARARPRRRSAIPISSISPGRSSTCDSREARASPPRRRRPNCGWPSRWCGSRGSPGWPVAMAWVAP